MTDSKSLRASADKKHPGFRDLELRSFLYSLSLLKPTQRLPNLPSSPQSTRPTENTKPNSHQILQSSIRPFSTPQPTSSTPNPPSPPLPTILCPANTTQPSQNLPKTPSSHQGLLTTHLTFHAPNVEEVVDLDK